MENNVAIHKKIKLLSPKIDVVFHALFREDNKELLEVLISDVLEEKVKVVFYLALE